MKNTRTGDSEDKWLDDSRPEDEVHYASRLKDEGQESTMKDLRLKNKEEDLQRRRVDDERLKEEMRFLQGTGRRNRVDATQDNY
ncbi:hypothetical protein CEXT_590961 [Caerostris extrusa]|uniref:Uncharacterized protein n=1 Tax=Caerostris extrusa TaxID=172846 RepID=A0AAV4SAG9_CAEEX|nr:hypothetical protein CEXT_590961 [Caerostris extrusa]